MIRVRDLCHSSAARILFVAFLGDHRGPIRLPHVLHAEDDVTVLCGLAKARGHSASSSVLF